MRHTTVEELVDYVDGKSAGSNKQTLENHLASCEECADLKVDLQSLMTRLKEDSRFEPPAQLVQWAVGIFQPVLQVESKSKVRRIVAALIFDSYDQPMTAGVRHVGEPPRQLLFRAGDVDVDVRIESLEANNCINLAGQVLSTAPRFFHNASVRLESNGIIRYHTSTNVVGEFSFDEVPGDTYHLSVDLPEGQITLFCVNRGNS